MFKLKENKHFKGYKSLRKEFLHWSKTRFLDTLKVIYNPDDDDYMKAFKIEWDKDPKCKDISLEIFTHPSFKEKDLVPVGEPILIGKDSKAEEEIKFGDLIPSFNYVSSHYENSLPFKEVMSPKEFNEEYMGIVQK